VNGGDTSASRGDEPIHVPADERAAGLGSGRTERRRRASLVPLIFLVVGSLVVGVFAYFRGQDELSSTITQTLGAMDGRTQVDSVVSITNKGAAQATILSVGANAGGAILSEEVVMALAGTSTTYGALDELVIPVGQTVVINYEFVFECTTSDEFFIDVVVRVQVRQKGLFRVFAEPDGNTNGPRYMCVEGVAVDAAPGP